MKLNQEEQRHYNREQATAKLIQTCYREQCMGNRLTPEKLFALCQLTWFAKNWRKVKLLALWNLWDKGNNLPDLDKPTDLVLYDFPQEVIQYANEDTGFVNYYRPFRQPSREWVQQNFPSLAPLIHRVATLTNDDEIIEVAKCMESLPKISQWTRKAEMSSSSLLTPLFACLDPRQRFPVANKAKHVTGLHRKLGITLFALPDKIDTLIQLIGQYGISNALMLDVVSNQLLGMKLEGSPSPEFHKEKEKDLTTKDTDDVDVIIHARSIKAKRLHNKMTNQLKKLCESAKLKIKEGDKLYPYDALIVDYDGHGKDILVEAKSSVNRPELRLAVGQLFDYRRGLKRRAATDLAVLLPDKPDQDSMTFLDDVGVNILWFTDKQLTSIDGKLKL